MACLGKVNPTDLTLCRMLFGEAMSSSIRSNQGLVKLSYTPNYLYHIQPKGESNHFPKLLKFLHHFPFWEFWLDSPPLVGNHGSTDPFKRLALTARGSNSCRYLLVRDLPGTIQFKIFCILWLQSEIMSSNRYC